MKMLNGLVRFYDSNGEMLYERRYHSLEGRLAMIEQICEKPSVSYYHVLPNYAGIPIGTKLKDRVDKHTGFVRPPARYDNRQFG